MRLTVNQDVRGSSPRWGANQMLLSKLDNKSQSLYNRDNLEIYLAFVQRIGQHSSKVFMGVRFPHAGPKLVL